MCVPKAASVSSVFTDLPVLVPFLSRSVVADQIRAGAGRRAARRSPARPAELLRSPPRAAICVSAAGVQPGGIPRIRRRRPMNSDRCRGVPDRARNAAVPRQAGRERLAEEPPKQGMNLAQPASWPCEAVRTARDASDRPDRPDAVIDRI